jgi:undecaprenyl-diphosphatase
MALLAFLALLALAVTLGDLPGREIVGRWGAVQEVLASVGTFLGDSAVYLIPIGLVLLALPALRAGSHRVGVGLTQMWLWLLVAFVAIAGSGLAANILKHVVGRGRPLQFDDGALHFSPFTLSAKFASFPSGHATTAGALAVLLILTFGLRCWPVGLAFVAFVCASRVALGAHFLSDVLAGAAFGAAFALATARWFARRGLVFTERPDGWLEPRGASSIAALPVWRRHFRR